ncbi:hypothetical protein KEH56_10255 [Burkholderia cenocepacia]|uniref:hypothetical protein n=1 Tax=Burkholderia cenocepacia TaxID=95486 RepID=UPI001BAA83AC|nr:hypothetical protein [Burkholderia cenocepacia]QUN38611.1 hypothetical protein KEH56_10255 [Burkholderia cenocepacia]QUO29486.1 hypothetical protein KEH57_23720 [Burkholderia cenocepacia]
MTNQPNSHITIRHAAGRTTVRATGHFARPFLDALANGAPSGEAAAFSAWLTYQPRAVSEVAA